MRPLSHVRPGDPLNAGQQNRIIDRINELGRMGNNERGLAMFEATADLTYASPLDATAPHCTAKRLYYNGVNRDRKGDYTKAVDTVYMSIADYSGSAYLGTVHIEEGDRFWAVWDSQAGRWEVVMGAEGDSLYVVTWGPQWDDTLNEAYLLGHLAADADAETAWAKPTDYGAESKLYLPLATRNHGVMTLTGGSYPFNSRVVCGTVNGRLTVKSPPHDDNWYPTYHYSGDAGSATTPPYAVDRSATVLYHATNGTPAMGYFSDLDSGLNNGPSIARVNGPKPLTRSPSDLYGTGTLAIGTPALCLIASDAIAHLTVTRTAGEWWGQAPGTYKLYPGLPGFICLGGTPVEVDADDDLYALRFVQCLIGGVFTAKATSNWVKRTAPDPHYIDAHPCADHEGNYPYDGTTYDLGSGRYITLPDLTFRIGLLQPHVRTRDPNLEEGNVFQYSVGQYDDPALCSLGFTGYYAINDYLDDKIGTVKMWSGAVVDIPQGWGLMDGSGNAAGSGFDLSGRFVVGYDSGDAAFDMIGETGGANVHTHSSGTGLASGTDLDSQASNLPPYLTLAYIERLDNSA